MTDLQNPTPTPADAATPAATPEPASSAGTVQPTGDAGNRQSAPSEEGFTRVDPNTLPPQLRQAYDNMLRDYKEKTTKLSEEQKKYADYDAHKQKSGFYDEFLKHEKLVKFYNDYVKELNGQAGQNGQAQPQDQTAEIRRMVEEVRMKQQQTEMSEIVNAFAQAADEKGELLNPNLDALGSITLGKAPNGEEYSLLRACIDLSGGNTPQERLANGYKAANAIRDQILEEGRKQGMGKMLSKVRTSTQAPTITSDKATPTGDPKKWSVREARENAERGVVVKP